MRHPNPLMAADEREIIAFYTDDRLSIADISNHQEIAMKQNIANLIELMRIPAGEFLMGSDPTDKDAFADEKPQHLVHVAEFEISKYPITETQYDVFAKATNRKSQLRKGKEAHPVINVSWHDALAFCQWLSQETGQTFRLPTEAEWEKAARGTDGRRYPWSGEFDKTKCNTYESGIGGTTPVGLYLEGASPYGVMDMAGNVWEWCSSAYKPYPYRADDGREDLQSDAARVLRGGSWGNIQRNARCTFRGDDGPSIFSVVGLRVVVAPG